MEELQRIVGESGEAVAIWREWELRDEAVKWLLSQKGYVQLNRFDHSAADAADHGDDYVLLLQVLRDLESLERACKAGQEVVVVARSLVEQEEAEGGAGSAPCKLLASFSYLEFPKRDRSGREKSVDAEPDDLRYYYRILDCESKLLASDSDNDAVEKQPVAGRQEEVVVTRSSVEHKEAEGGASLYKSDRPRLLSWISGNKLPKLPFSRNTPPLENLEAVSWRLPISAMRNLQQELAVKIRLCFHMRLVFLTARVLSIKVPNDRMLPLEQEFGPFIFELPAALLASDAALLASEDSDSASS